MVCQLTYHDMALFNAILSGWSTGLVVDDETIEVNGTDPSVAASEAIHSEQTESLSAGAALAAGDKKGKTKGVEDLPDEVSRFSCDAMRLVRGHVGLDFCHIWESWSNALRKYVQYQVYFCERLDLNMHVAAC